jgi:hypothetical protein
MYSKRAIAKKIIITRCRRTQRAVDVGTLRVF